MKALMMFLGVFLIAAPAIGGDYFYICYTPAVKNKVGSNPGCIVCQKAKVNPDPKLLSAKKICPRGLGVDFMDVRKAQEFEKAFCGCHRDAFALERKEQPRRPVPVDFSTSLPPAPGGSDAD